MGSRTRCHSYTHYIWPRTTQIIVITSISQIGSKYLLLQSLKQVKHQLSWIVSLINTNLKKMAVLSRPEKKKCCNDKDCEMLEIEADLDQADKEARGCGKKTVMKLRDRKGVDPELGRVEVYTGGVWKHQLSGYFGDQTPQCAGSAHKKGFCCVGEACPPKKKHPCCARPFFRRLANGKEKEEANAALERSRKRLEKQLKKQNQPWEEVEQYFKKCQQEIRNSGSWGITKVFVKQILRTRLPYGTSLRRFRRRCEIPKRIKLFPFSRQHYIDEYGAEYKRILSQM